MSLNIHKARNGDLHQCYLDFIGWESPGDISYIVSLSSPIKLFESKVYNRNSIIFDEIWVNEWMNIYINKKCSFYSPWSIFGVLITFFISYFAGVFSFVHFSIIHQKLPVICLLYCPSSTKQHFSPNVHLLHLGDELHYSIYQFKCICKIITPLSYPRLVIWINVSLIKLAAGLSLRNTTIRSHGTRAQKRVSFKHQHLLPTSLIRRNEACIRLPTQCWLLIKWPWYVWAKEIRKQT